MRMNNHWVIRKQRLVDLEGHREEVEWTLNAIVGTIVTGRLPIDDAFAWARIARWRRSCPCAFARLPPMRRAPEPPSSRDSRGREGSYPGPM